MTREPGVDLARGFAVCTMVVAHTSPSAVDLPTEYLTAPLFALLIGLGLGLARARWGASAAGFVAQNLWRGTVLIVLGTLLQRSYPFIDVVLQTLGVLTIVLAPLVLAIGRRPVAALAGAGLMALLSPVLMSAAREWLMRAGMPAPWLADAVGWLAAGTHYRTSSDLAFGLVGVALATWLRGTGERIAPLIARAPLAVGGLAGLTLIAYGGGRLAGMDTHPYSGSTAEIVGSCAFAAGTVIACCWLVTIRTGSVRVLAPLIATGRLALTAYALQILLLAALFRASGPTFDDNDWRILAGLIGLLVVACWAWVRWVRRPGPLEGLVRLPRRFASVDTPSHNVEE